MRAGTIHFVISLDNCAATGLHGHCAAALSAGIWCALHNVMTDNATTNADHATAHWLLIRIFIFQARHLLAHCSLLHVPDLSEPTHVFDLINLMCFVILFPALDSAGYEHLDNGMLPMQRDRFAELMYAWDLTSELVAFIDVENNFESEEYATFEDVIDVRPFFLFVFLRPGHI
jgi:hypothetical protein